MSVVRFGLFTAIGSGIWNGAFIAAGWHLEERWEELERLLQPMGLTALALLAIGLGATAIRNFKAST